MIVLALFVALLLPAWAQATTYYVSTTGNDSNDGLTESTSKRTVAHCASIMVAGDTCYIRGGTYNEGQIWIRRPGTQAAPIKMLNYPGESPKIVFNDPTATPAQRLHIQHVSGANLAMGWITIEGLELENGWDGIKWHNLHDSTIRRNWVHDSRYQGMLGIGGTRVVIDRNVITDNGSQALCDAESWRCNQYHGIYAHGTYITITNNLIYDNLSFGITQNGSATAAYDPSKHPSTEFSGATNWIIANNTFAYNRYRGGIVVWSSRTSNSRIENNIFYENSVRVSTAPQGIEWSGGAGTGITIRNNIFYATGSGGTSGIGSTGATEGVNYTQSGNTTNTTNPAFVNGGSNSMPASPDWTLTSTSPAIGMGRVNEFPYNGSAPDSGAFETVGTPTAAITANKLAVTFPMSLNTPVQLSSATGWSITCTANPTACPGSPAITSVALKSGSSSVLEVTISGIASDTCSTGQDWKVSYNGSTGNVTDSANLGNPASYKVQKIFSFTDLLATNSCSGAPPTPPSGPYIWYKFDNNADDSSGNALHGTATGTSYVDAKVNQGVKMDLNENDYVSVPYGSGVNPTTQSLTIAGGIYIDPAMVSLTRLYFGAGSIGTSQRLYISTINSTWMLGIQGSSDGVGTSEFSVQPGWNRLCLRLDKDTPGAGTGTATLALNGVTGAGTGVVKTYTSYTFAANFKIGSVLGSTSGAGQINDEWKIYTSLVSCADDYAAWNTSSPPLTGTLDITASRWYGAKTQGESRVALAANNTTINIPQTSAVAYVAQTNCTVTNCDQISQRLYYTCAACPSAGSELPVPDVPTADGISFYGVTQEIGVLSGDHGSALTGSPTRIPGGTQTQAQAIPSFGLATGEAIVNTYVVQWTNAPLGAVYAVYPKEQTGTAFNSVTPTGGLTATIVSNSSGF